MQTRTIQFGKSKDYQHSGNPNNKGLSLRPGYLVFPKLSTLAITEGSGVQHRYKQDTLTSIQLTFLLNNFRLFLHFFRDLDFYFYHCKNNKYFVFVGESTLFPTHYL